MRMAKGGEVVKEERRGRQGRARLAKRGEVGKGKLGWRGRARSTKESEVGKGGQGRRRRTAKENEVGDGR